MTTIIDAPPFSITFDRSEPPPDDPRHTGSPALRPVAIHHLDNVLLAGMTGLLASHEIARDVFPWMGGGHGYETELGVRFSNPTIHIDRLVVESALGASGQDQALMHRTTVYDILHGSNTMALRISTTDRVLRPHKIRDTYTGMLPLVDAAWSTWAADDLPGEEIDPTDPPGNLLTPPVIGVGAHARALDIDLAYLGSEPAPIYMRHVDGVTKLYHRARWQRPLSVSHGCTMHFQQTLVLRA